MPRAARRLRRRFSRWLCTPLISMRRAFPAGHRACFSEMPTRACELSAEKYCCCATRRATTPAGENIATKDADMLDAKRRACCDFIFASSWPATAPCSSLQRFSACREGLAVCCSWQCWRREVVLVDAYFAMSGMMASSRRVCKRIAAALCCRGVLF